MPGIIHQGEFISCLVVILTRVGIESGPLSLKKVGVIHKFFMKNLGYGFPDLKHLDRLMEEVQSKKPDIDRFVEEYKKTCSAIGFELGTDKFTDCTLKLFVADNKETTQIVQSSSGVQEMIIYDPDREHRINMKKWNY